MKHVQHTYCIPPVRHTRKCCRAFSSNCPVQKLTRFPEGRSLSKQCPLRAGSIVHACNLFMPHFYYCCVMRFVQAAVHSAATAHTQPWPHHDPRSTISLKERYSPRAVSFVHVCGLPCAHMLIQVAVASHDPADHLQQQQQQQHCAF